MSNIIPFQKKPLINLPLMESHSANVAIAVAHLIFIFEYRGYETAEAWARLNQYLKSKG